MKNIKFDELIFTKPGIYNFTIKELTQSGYGWAVDDNVYRVIITVTDNEQGNLVATAEYPDGTPLFTNVFSCVPIKITICAEKIICGIRIDDQRGYDLCFTFGLFNEQNEMIATARNYDGIAAFRRLLFTAPGVYNYTIKELTEPFCCGWKTDDTIFPVEITVIPDINGKLEAHINFPNGKPVFINKFDHHCYCTCCACETCNTRNICNPCQNM